MKNSWVQWIAEELAIVLPYLFDSDLQYNLRQGWGHTFNNYCDHCSWKKVNNWLQCRWSLGCCNQSVHVHQNCLEQSQKHVCNGAYNYMETRFEAWEHNQLPIHSILGRDLYKTKHWNSFCFDKKSLAISCFITYQSFSSSNIHQEIF